MELFGEGEYTVLDQQYDDVTQVIRDEKGQIIFDITVDGYSTGGLQLLIGVDAEGAVAGISIVNIKETPGLGTKVQNTDFLDQFKGVTSPDLKWTPSPVRPIPPTA